MARGDKAAKALRDKLANRSQPFLPTSSPIRQVVMGQTGPSPWFFVLTLLIIFWIRYRLVCVTDDAIYVLRCSVGGRPKELLATLPRQQRLGPVSGVWAKLDLMGENLWVHKRFYKDIEAADATRPEGTPR